MLPITIRLAIVVAPLHIFLSSVDLGAVTSLQARAEEDGIVVSWSPPNIPSDTIVTYEVTYLSDDDRISSTTKNHEKRIIATQGDIFSITVTPFTDDSQGDNSTVTAGVDCELEYINTSCTNSLRKIITRTMGKAWNRGYTTY